MKAKQLSWDEAKVKLDNKEALKVVGEDLYIYPYVVCSDTPLGDAAKFHQMLHVVDINYLSDKKFIFMKDLYDG